MYHFHIAIIFLLSISTAIYAQVHLDTMKENLNYQSNFISEKDCQSKVDCFKANGSAEIGLIVKKEYDPLGEGYLQIKYYKQDLNNFYNFAIHSSNNFFSNHFAAKKLILHEKNNKKIIFDGIFGFHHFYAVKRCVYAQIEYYNVLIRYAKHHKLNLYMTEDEFFLPGCKAYGFNKTPSRWERNIKIFGEAPKTFE